MRLIVELDDATGDERLHAILDDLARHRPYVTGAVLEDDLSLAAPGCLAQCPGRAGPGRVPE